jgi:hypothetical protein
MKKTPMLLVLLIPILMIVIIAIGLVVQERKYVPAQEFVYAKGEYNAFTCEKLLEATLLNKPLPPFFNKPLSPFIKTVSVADCTPKISFFIYNFSNKSSKPVSFDQLKTIPLQNKVQSDEGYYILPSCMAESFFAFPIEPDRRSNLCVGLKHFQKSLDVEHDRDSFVTFIGWIPGTRS